MPLPEVCWPSRAVDREAVEGRLRGGPAGPESPFQNRVSSTKYGLLRLSVSNSLQGQAQQLPAEELVRRRHAN